MDGLSLSLLTYCCATVTVNFHRLDHPPFPCKGRLLPSTIQTQVPPNSRSRIHPPPAARHLIARSLSLAARKVLIHEACNHHWNTSNHLRHHRIRDRRNLLHPPEEGCRRWTTPDLPPNPGHPPHL